jgi:tetratricopeptide (TPR) repeat protein
MPKLRLLLLALVATVALAAERAPEQQAAVDLYNQRKNAEAKAAFEKLAAADAKNAEAWHYLGQLAQRSGDLEAAVKHAQKAVALAPGVSSYHLRLGDAYGQSAQRASVFSKMGLAGKCRDAYQKAVALDPKNVDARFAIMSFYQQAPGIIGGGMDKAYNEAAEIQKLDAARGREAHERLYLADKKHAEAFALWEPLLRDSPDSYLAHFRIGRLAAITGEQMDRGLELLKKCLGLTPPPGVPGHEAVHFRIGTIMEKKGDKAAAKAAYETALKLAPQFGQAAEALNKLK